MKPIHFYILSVAFILTSCAGVKNIPFSEDRFHVSAKTGYVQNADSTLRFTFCTGQIDREIPLIDNDITTSYYNNLPRYLNKVCSQLKVECDSILFYAPSYGTLLVCITESEPWKPQSQTTNMTDEKPYTGWVRYDDDENWERKPDELYSNIEINKRDKQLLIIDRFTYGGKNLAMIRIIQTDTKSFKKIDLPRWTGTWVDVTDPTSLEPIANWVDGHRKVAIANYYLGLLR